MIVRPRFAVPGEDLPSFVAWTLTAIGMVSAVGLSFEWGRSSSSTAVDIAPVSSPVPESHFGDGGHPSVVVLDPDAASSGAPDAAPARPCPPFIVTFGKGVGAPPKAAEAGLGRLAAWLAEHPVASVTIDGHADASGSEETNLWLSRQRAFGVRAVLEKNGVTRSRITTRSFGSFWPADESPPDASWNRRVVVSTRAEDCPGTESFKP